MNTKIIGYRGIANGQKVIIAGHVFERHKVRVPDPNHHYLYNFKQAIRRFRVSPYKKVEVEVVIGDDHKYVKTSKSGYFVCEFEHSDKKPGWYDYKLFIKNQTHGFSGEYKVVDDKHIGVISDIDDTVLVSHATKLLRKLRLILFKNAYTRKPVHFIKDWYRHLQEFDVHMHPEDYFYVSNSEWNLYDFLIDFFDIYEMPKGIFMLQNLKRGVRDVVNTGRVNSAHKEESIDFLMRFYPKKRFVLVGDNGQKDMDIYSKVSNENPHRIVGVMIRKLPYVKNEHRMDKFRAEMNALGIPVIYFR